MNGNRLKAVAFLVTLILASCSEEPKSSNETRADSSAKATSTEPVSGRTAFWELYKSAHAWSADLLPLKLESKTVPGVKNEAGKAGMWAATFGSPSRREARTFTYAVIASPPDIYKGVTIGNPLPWTGPTRDALAFTTSDFAIDSDAAYTTASAQAEAWAKGHPGREVSFILGNASRFPAPVWSVLWGDEKSGYLVFVNAKTGSPIKQ